MRIWSSVGSITFAAPLLLTVAISLLLLLEVFEYDIQLPEALRPRALVGLHPVVDGLQRAAVQAIQPLPSVFAHVDRAHLPEHSQVLRYLGLSEAEQRNQVVHGPLAAGEGVDDLTPPRLGHRVERVRRGSCSGHAAIIYSHTGICQMTIIGAWRARLIARM